MFNFVYLVVLLVFLFLQIIFFWIRKTFSISLLFLSSLFLDLIRPNNWSGDASSCHLLAENGFCFCSSILLVLQHNYSYNSILFIDFNNPKFGIPRENNFLFIIVVFWHIPSRLAMFNNHMNLLCSFTIVIFRSWKIRFIYKNNVKEATANKTNINYQKQLKAILILYRKT